MMRFRPAGFVALVVAVTLIVSAVQTCVPGAMTDMAGADTPGGAQMACHEAAGGGGAVLHPSGSVVSGLPTVCCKTVEPLVLTKSDSLSGPNRDALRWITPIVLDATVFHPVSVAATASPPFLESIVPATAPRYVLLRTLLI